MNEIKINLLRPHKTQIEVLELRERFNTIICGRRWGKTTMATVLAAETTLIREKPLPFGYFSPTHKMNKLVWDEFKNTFEPVIRKKDERNHMIWLKNNPSITPSMEFWSLEDTKAGRSRKYGRVVLDEFAFAKRQKELWELAIRPTLTDYKGDAYIMSSPLGTDSYLYQMFLRGGHKSWRSFQYSIEDNPLIDRAEILSIKDEYINDRKSYDREYGGKFIDLMGDRFFAAYDRSVSFRNADFNPNFPRIDLKLDFNQLSSCIISQHYTEREADDFPGLFPNKGVGGIMNLKCYRNELSLLAEMVAESYGHGTHNFRITGDVSGKQTGATETRRTAFAIFENALRDACRNIHDSDPIIETYVPKRWVGYKLSRLFAARVMGYYGGNYVVDNRYCSPLDEDFMFLQSDNDGGMVKPDPKIDKGHFGDAERYGYHKFERRLINSSTIDLQNV